MKNNALRSKIFTLIGLFLVLLIILTIWGITEPDDGGKLVFWFLLALVITILTLCIITAVFHILHTHKEGEDPHAEFALGLPAGSVRALIALSLLTGFICVSAYLYNSISKPSVVTSYVDQTALLQLKEVLKVDTIDAVYAIDTVLVVEDSVTTRLPTREMVTPVMYKVEHSVGPNEAAKDFALQLLTILGGLVTAVSSFYFGAKTTQQSLDKVDKIVRQTNDPDSNNDDPDGPPVDDGPPPAPPEVLAEFYQANAGMLKKKYGALAVGLGKKETGDIAHQKDCVVFMVESKKDFNSSQKIDDHLTYEAGDGVTYKIHTDVREEEEIRVAALPQPGDSLTVGNVSGTFGLVVEKEIGGAMKDCVLSCFHVMCDPEFDSDDHTFKPSMPPREVSVGGTVIGEVISGKLTPLVDGALAVITGTVNTQIDHNVIVAPKGGVRVIDKEEIDSAEVLYCSGGASNKQSGNVKAYKVNATIHHKNKTFDLQNLVVTQKLSDQGDSGAPVVAKDGRIVGIVVANSKTKSYIQPIKELLRQLECKLKLI